MKQLLIAFMLIIFAASCSSKKEIATDAQSEARVQQDGQEREGRRQGPPSIEEVFKMDTNGDGLLAKSEVKGRLLERFDVIDANKNGLISKEEFENAPKPQRGKNRGQIK